MLEVAVIALVIASVELWKTTIDTTVSMAIVYMTTGIIVCCSICGLFATFCQGPLKQDLKEIKNVHQVLYYQKAIEMVKSFESLPFYWEDRDIKELIDKTEEMLKTENIE